MTAAEISPTPYQLLPRLTDEEYEALKTDIAENGIRVPIDVDENGVVLDGHHRAWIAADLDVACPQRVVSGLDEIGKRNYARAVNALRRHLTRDARREQVAQMREEGQSIRMIAGTLGVPKSTVADDLAQVSETGHLKAGGSVSDEDELAGVPNGTPEPPPVAEPIVNRETGEVLVTADEIADLAVYDDVSKDEFETALSAARAQSDLSRQNVVANLPARDSSPEPAKPVTGLDGKQYKPTNRKPPRKALTEVAKSRGFALRQAMDSVLKLTEDDRYRTNEKQVADALRGHLLYVAETVAAVLDQLP